MILKPLTGIATELIVRKLKDGKYCDSKAACECSYRRKLMDRKYCDFEAACGCGYRIKYRKLVDEKCCDFERVWLIYQVS